MDLVPGKVQVQNKIKMEVALPGIARVPAGTTSSRYQRSPRAPESSV